MSKILSALILSASSVFAQGSWNNWQPILPGRNNSIARTSGRYNFGYPAFGSSQLNVVAQWAGRTWGLGASTNGGNAVDRVSSVSLAPVGSPTYGVVNTGAYSGISPCVAFGGTNYFHTDSAQASLNLGTSDFVIEIWLYSTDSASGSATVFDTLSATDMSGYQVRLAPATNQVILSIRTAAAITNAIWTISSIYDGLPHKLRFSSVRASNSTLYKDGFSQGAVDISARSADSIPASSVHIGVRNAIDHGFGFTGGVCEVRVTVGNSTNNSGGPNGG